MFDEDRYWEDRYWLEKEQEEQHEADANTTLGLTLLIGFFVFCWICS